MFEEVNIEFFDICVNVGRIGCVILYGVMRLVIVVGFIVEMVIFYNVFEVKCKGVFIGDIVVLCKVGDVILEIFGLVVELCNGIEWEFFMFDYCLSCGVELVYEKNGDKDFCCFNV